MEDSFAKKIIDDMAHIYNTIAEPFSVTRQRPWPEFGTLMDMINTMSLMNQANPKIKQIKVLDVGCGNGRVAEIVTKINQSNVGTGLDLSLRYVGIDLSEKLIGLARQKYPTLKFLVGSMLDLPFLDNQFDIVIAIASLQHIPSQKLRVHALQEFHRVTKPSGVLFMLNWNLYQPRWEKYFVVNQPVGTGLDPLRQRSEASLSLRPDNWDPGDALIPWKDSNGNILAQRYYHGFTDDELKQLLHTSGWKLQEQYFSENKRNIVTIATPCQNPRFSV